MQRLGPSSRRTPKLTTGDVNADGIEDIFVTMPNNARGSVTVFDGGRLGAAILTIDTTLPSTPAASILTVNAFDRSGDGVVDLVTAYRSVAGAVASVSQFNLAGTVQKSFVANLLAITDLTGYWLAETRAIHITQMGDTVVVDGGSRGKITGKRLALPSQGRLAGSVSGDVIRWSNGKVWRRITLDGVWSIADNDAQIVQRGQNLWLMRDRDVASMVEWGLDRAKLQVRIDGQVGTVAWSANGWELQWSDGAVSRPVSRSQPSLRSR